MLLTIGYVNVYKYILLTILVSAFFSLGFFLRSLKSVFSSCLLSFIIQVVHAVCTDDAVTILKNYCVDMKNFEDSLLMASQLGLKRQSLRKLVAMFLGQRLYKKHQRSDW